MSKRPPDEPVMTRREISKLMFVAGASAAFGCSHRPRALPPQVAPEVPEWLTRGSGAFDGYDGRVFYGVGMAEGIRNPVEANAVADSHARTEISKVLDTYSDMLIGGCLASFTSGDMRTAIDKRAIEQAIRPLVAETLRGVQIVDHWYAPSGAGVFALARLEVEYFTKRLTETKTLPGHVRNCVKENAERIHEQMQE